MVLVVDVKVCRESIGEHLLDVIIVDVFVDQMVPPKDAAGIAVDNEDELLQSIEQD